MKWRQLIRGIYKSMKLFTVGLIILVSALVISSIALNSSTALLASSKGLNLHLTVDTNLESQDDGCNNYEATEPK
jgi:hypothetical protein